VVDKLTGDQGPVELSSGDEVEVESVVKGDEIVVNKNGGEARVRLLGVHAFSDVIDNPDLRQMHEESVAYLKETVVGRKVTVIFGRPVKDVHGRYLAYVSAEGKDINRAMLEAGSVCVYTEFAFDREPGYLKAESEARAERKGLWATDASLELITALRKQWSGFRSDRGEPAPHDELLKAAP
jgi:endonuclease YncB( thermonuclease family)